VLFIYLIDAEPRTFFCFFFMAEGVLKIPGIESQGNFLAQ